MKPTSSALMERIECFELDAADATDPLSRRVARDNGWSRDFTLRVIREYKRFLLLALTADHVVTPSVAVDQVWHHHLLYTASYRRFCRDVLGQRLDHAPSRGADEQDRYIEAYELTLASYEEHFVERAPSDIWPDSERRFGADERRVRVDVAASWVVPKPKVWRWLAARFERVCAPLSAFTGALATMGCASGAFELPQLSGPAFLRAYLACWAALLAAAWAIGKVRWAATEGRVPALEPYSLAQLAGGSAKALNAASTALLAREVLSFDGSSGTLRVQRPLPPGLPQLEQDVFAEVARTGALTLDRLHQQAAKLTQGLAKHLHALGLTTSEDFKVPFWLALAAPIVAVGRIVSRLGSGKPILFLVVLCIIGVLVAFGPFRPRVEATALGRAVLAAARSDHQSLRTPTSAADLATAGTLPLAFALFGLGAITLAETGWPAALRRYGDSGLRSAGESGCSGDSGGCSGDSGGCGGDSGCGGCGGGGGCGGCS